jgi:hypothetical protein
MFCFSSLSPQLARGRKERKLLWGPGKSFGNPYMDSDEERVAVVTPAQEEPEPVTPLLQERIRNVSRKAPAVPCTPSRTIRKTGGPPRTPCRG